MICDLPFGVQRSEEMALLTTQPNLSPVGQSEGEELQTGGLEEEVDVGFAQLVDAGDAVAEPPDHLKEDISDSNN